MKTMIDCYRSQEPLDAESLAVVANRDYEKGFIDSESLAALENSETLARKKFALWQNNNIRCVIIQVGRNQYIIKNLYGVEPTNDRAMCTAAGAESQSFGRGFMGLGGNSVPSSTKHSTAH